MKHFFNRFLRCLFTLLLLQDTALAQFNYFSLPAGRKHASIPFTNRDNLVVIDVLLNDSLPVKLMLDSGVEGVIITDQVAGNYFSGWCIRSYMLSAPGTPDLLDACITRPVKLKVSNLQPMFSNLIVLSEDYFSLDQYIGAPVHGLIGIEKFGQLAITTDYDRSVIRFTRPEDFKPSARAAIIPLSINRGKPYMTSRIALDDCSIRDVWLMIDSGANHPILLEYDSLDGYLPQKSLDAVIGKGLAGNIHGSFARLNWMMLGNFRLDNPICSFTSTYYPGNLATRLHRNGTLGAGALSRFRTTFDYTGNRMILEKGGKFKKKFEYNMSGVIFRALGHGFSIFEVNEVIPGSPGSEAGIKAGDILMSVNGKPVFGLDLGELNHILSEKHGAVITMTLSRNGMEQRVRIKLRRLI